MFIGVIIVAIIMLAVLLIVVASQQIQIDEINKQNTLEIELNSCNLIIVNSNPYSLDSQNQAEIEWEKCFRTALEKYGNNEQQVNFENSRLEKQQEQEAKDNLREMLDKDCRERYIGQIQEMTDCIEGNHRILP